MAIETTDYYISPTDGWVEVATAPTYVFIKPTEGFAYRVAITDAAPPVDNLRGAVINDGQPFEFQIATEDGDVYVRVDRKPEQRPLHFGVITDGTPS